MATKAGNHLGRIIDGCDHAHGLYGVWVAHTAPWHQCTTGRELGEERCGSLGTPGLVTKPVPSVLNENRHRPCMRSGPTPRRLQQ